MDRRSYLKNSLLAGSLATGSVAALAGCADLSESEDTDTAEDDPDDSISDDESDDEEVEEEEESEDDPTDGELTGTFDDFEDLEPWSAFQDIGSIEESDEEVYEGSQSALLEPDDEGQVRVRRSLDEPIDITNHAPGIAMAAETSSTVRIQLQDSDGDYVEFSQQVLDEMSTVRKNFGLTRVRGDPDLENIIVLQIINWIDEDADDGQLWVDDFYFAPKTETGKVMLQFHGGYEGHYSEAYPILEAYDMTGTTFLPTDRVRADQAVDGDRLTEDQVAELAESGWTIGSHSSQGTPLSDVDSPDGELESDITEPIDWLEDEGYDEGARFFAFPGSEYNDASYELVQENYDLAFAGRAPAQGYAANPHLCSVTPSPDDPSEGRELLDWTADHGGITTIPFFALDDEEAVTTLEETVEYLDELVADGELEIITPAEMADQYVF